MTRKRRKPVEAPTEELVMRYSHQLSELVSVLPRGMIDWQLDGGMAVAAHIGKFTRRHRDIDVGIFSVDLKAFEKRLHQCQWALFSRNPIYGLEYTPVDLVRRTNACEVLSRDRVKRLTAFKVDARGRPVWDCERLIRFDVHVHEPRRETILLTRNRIPFPNDLFFGSRAERTLNGCDVPVARAPFLYFFKLRRGSRRPRHLFDLRAMERQGLVSDAEKKRLGLLLEMDEEAVSLRAFPPLRSLDWILEAFTQKTGTLPERS